MLRVARLGWIAVSVVIAAASCGEDAARLVSAAGTTGAGGGAAAGTGGAAGAGGAGAAGGSAPCADAGPPGQPCTTDDDCSTSAPCPVCPDGVRLCAYTSCKGGACAFELPACPACEPTDCGAACQLHCDANGCTFGVCDGSGQCVPTPGPACGPACMVDAECPQPKGPCTACPGGTPACEVVVCSFGSCQAVAPTCPVLSCAGQPCGTSCSDASSLPGLCDGAGDCVPPAHPVTCAPGKCAASWGPYGGCPGGNGIFMSWDGCTSTDLAACVAGICGFEPTTCSPSDPCQGAQAGAPCLPLCGEIGCPTPNPLPSAHCDAGGVCVVDPPLSCGGSAVCAKNADCPSFTSPSWEPCASPSPLGCLLPICVEGACATFVTQARETSCTAMDAHAGPTTCPSQRRGFAWDGTSCVPLLACACAGQDCDALLPSLAVCQALHEQC